MAEDSFRKSFQEIAAKAEWEGGLEDALEWFQPNQVPHVLEMRWKLARSMKDDLANAIQEISDVFFAEAGIDIS